MKANLRKTYNIIIRLAVAIFTIAFIYDQLFYRKDISSVFEAFSNISQGFSLNILLTFALILFPVNILLESVKWKYLIDKLEKVSLYTAIKGVVVGKSVSMIMPNRVGDYIGRVFMLKKADRVQAILSTFLGSLAQFITTIIFGLTALIFYFPEYLDITIRTNAWLFIGLIVVIISIIFILIFTYLNFAFFSVIIKRFSGKYYVKIEKYAEVFSWYNLKELLNVLLLSIIRYAVFSLQFYLLLQFFGVNISYFVAMMLVAITYLLMTIIPTIALTEIGVRGSISMFVFKHHFEVLGLWNSEFALSVVSASSMLWLINLIFPAILGTIFVFSLKFFRKRNGN